MAAQIPPWLSSNPIELYEAAKQNRIRNDIAGAQMTQQMFQQQAQLQQRRQEEARQAAQQLLQNDLAQQAFAEQVKNNRMRNQVDSTRAAADLLWRQNEATRLGQKTTQPIIRSGQFGVVSIDPLTGQSTTLVPPPEKVQQPIIRSGPFGVVSIDPKTLQSTQIVDPQSKAAANANKGRWETNPKTGEQFWVSGSGAPHAFNDPFVMAQYNSLLKQDMGLSQASAALGDEDVDAKTKILNQRSTIRKAMDKLQNAGRASLPAAPVSAVAQNPYANAPGFTEEIDSGLPVQEKPSLATPQSKADLDALESGALYVNPADGKTYRKK